MTLTPAIKSQLTKAINQHGNNTKEWAQRGSFYPPLYAAVRAIFQRHMPAEQAKHATKRYLLAVAI